MNYFTDNNQKTYVDRLLGNLFHKSPAESEEAKNTLLRDITHGSIMVDPIAFSEENPSSIIPRTYDSSQYGLHPYDGMDEIYMQQCSSDSETS